MKVNINKISSNQVEIEVEIPAPRLGVYFDLAASELSKDMKVDGFRPGKVPAEIVEREKGSQELYNQVANLAIQKTLPRAILDNEIEIVGQPEIQVIQIARGNPMKYKAIFWMIPEVELGKYKEIRVKRKKLKVEDREVDKSLEYLQKSRVKLVTVNRPARNGDRLEIDFSTRLGGVKIENGESKNHPLILGEARFMLGFEKELEGMKTGEEKEFSLKVPEEWPQKNLVGKNLDFQVKLNLVQERDIPKLSDEFVKSLGDFKSLDQFKKSIKEGIFQEKEQKEKDRIRTEIIERIADSSKIDMPEALVVLELDKMVNELRASVGDMGLDFDKYLSQINPSPSAEGEGVKKTVEELRKGWRNQAEKRARISLVLRAIAKKEKIEIGDDEVKERVNETLKHHPDTEEAKKNLDIYALKEHTKSVIRNERVFELLEREAKII